MANSREANTALPELAGFILCEKILTEEDKVPSLIRCVDTLTLPQGAELENGEIAEWPLWIALFLKTADARGKRKARMFLVNPSQKSEKLWEETIDFAEPEEGGEAKYFPLRIRWDGPGLYWLEIEVEDKKFARMPIRVRPATLPVDPLPNRVRDVTPKQAKASE
jgi:hypothetical protein